MTAHLVQTLTPACSGASGVRERATQPSSRLITSNLPHQAPPRTSTLTPHSTMMISSVKALLTLTLTLVGLANACATAERELQVADVSAKMLEAVNRKRTEKGLVAVCINEKLMRAAQVLADDMAQNNFVDTTGSDGSKLADRAAAQSMNVSASAEVVAAGYSSAERVVALWSEDSDSFIYSDLPFVGPGYKYDASKRYKHYWVLDFAVAEDEVCA